LIFTEVTDKNESFRDTIFISQVDSKSGEIQHPSLRSD
jgi:hypothetical protein